MLLVGAALAVLAAPVALGQQPNWGKLAARNPHPAVEGSIHVVDAATLQLVNFRVAQKGLQLSMRLQSPAAAPVDFKALYLRKKQRGDEYLRPINLGAAKFIPSRRQGLVLVAKYPVKILPGSRLVFAKRSGEVVVSVPLNVGAIPAVPRKAVGGPFTNPAHIPYTVAGSSVRILSDRSYKISNFVFDGSRPPDGWIYGGRGGGPSKDASAGVRLKMENYDAGFGADGRVAHCAMTSDVSIPELVVTLPPGMTTCDLNFLGVYCYAYAEDFGFTPLRNVPTDCSSVPAYLPPVRAKALKLPSRNCALKARREGRGSAAVDNWDNWEGQ